MIPSPIIAAVYFILAVGVVATIGRDSPSMIPGRLFLTMVCLAWAGFYIAIDILDWRAFTFPTADVLRVLSRWLHLSNATAIGLIVWGRWYLSKKIAEQ